MAGSSTSILSKRENVEVSLNGRMGGRGLRFYRTISNPSGQSEATSSDSRLFYFL